MKILAIRGQNLASLAGAFEVDLAKPPFAGAGLFAITGPTGAGKSTLLDAMCLALYDETPRLGAKSSVLVGDPEDLGAEKLSASDVRSILRKGTVSGYAEVDFLGQDGKRHRVRWSVRRAHGNVKKGFTAQTMTLEHLDTGERAAGTKKEILAQTEALVGLSFEQFRRSALLPQGDFAAFLQAKGGARAELLEKVTGTELYGRISVLAFERAKAEKGKLDQIEAGLASVQPLSTVERAALEADLEGAQRALGEHKAMFLVLRDAQAWYQTLDGLEGQRAEAAHALEQAEASWKAVEAARVALAEIEGAQALRAPLEAADQAERVVRGAREEVVHAEGIEATAGQEFGRTADALAKAKEALDAHAAKRAAEQPAITRARALDADLVTARRALEDAEDTAAARSADAEAARVAARRLEQELTKATASVTSVETMLAKQAKLDRLTDEWPRWRDAMGRASASLTLLAMIDLPSLADVETRARVLHETHVAAFGAAERAFDEAQAEAVKADQALAALDPETARRERAALDARKLSLSKLETALQDVLRAGRELSESKAHEATARSKQSEAEAQAKEDERARERVADKLEAARSKLEAAQAVRDLESYRAQLVEGHECPLCGAHEHPFGKGAPRVDERIEKANAEVVKWTEEQAALDRSIAASRSKAENQRESAVHHADAATQRTKELAKATKGYASARKACSDEAMPVDPAAEGAANTVSARVKDVEDQLRKASALDAKVAKLEKAAKAARDARDARHGELQAARKPMDASKEHLDDANRAHIQATAQAKTARGSLDVALEEVSPAFDATGPFRAEFERDPSAFEQRHAKLVASHRDARQARSRALEVLTDLRPKVSEATARLTEREQALTAARDAAAGRRGAVEKLVIARRDVLEGEATEAVVARLARRIEAAEAAVQVASTHHQTAMKAHVEATTVVGHMKERLREAEATLSAAQSALAGAIGARTVEALRALLAHDARWVAAERARFRAVRSAVERATIVLEERVEQHTKHLATGAPPVTAAGLPQAITDAQQAMETRDAQRAALDLRLRSDDQAREQQRAKAKEAEAQQRLTAFWQSMSGLIGSADGKKLRVFAQSLIFAALLEEANHFLGELSRRYSLAPAAQGDLELQVIDHDMADEVRSSSTLSGGESFLVSLALSLGLSALGASKTRVESVFIDEGFGTLDNRSLDMALASLESLQATGRQIGVISHVDRLATKIGAKVTIKRTGVQSMIVIG